MDAKSVNFSVKRKMEIMIFVTTIAIGSGIFVYFVYDTIEVAKVTTVNMGFIGLSKNLTFYIINI
jgi:hypothetical protein